MAILERTLTGDFTTILTELDAVVKQSVSATLEGSSDFNFSTGRCAVRVYERYSAIGNGRVTMSLTLLEADGQIRLSAITSGGSQAVFFQGQHLRCRILPGYHPGHSGTLCPWCTLKSQKLL